MARNGSIRSIPGEPRANDDELTLRRARELVRTRPLVAVAVAAAVGATLGGVLFSRAGRFTFFAAVGYVANELWRRESRVATGSLT